MTYKGQNIYDVILQNSHEMVELICREAELSLGYGNLSEKEKEKADKVIWYLRVHPYGRHRPVVPESVELIFLEALGL